MKKDITFRQGKKEYTISFNIRSLAELERSIGRSLVFIYFSGPAGMIRQCDITFTANALKYGLKDIGDKDPYDVIDEFCDAGGILDTLNGYILEAINETGFFIKAKKAAEEPEEPEEPEKSKKVTE